MDGCTGWKRHERDKLRVCEQHAFVRDGTCRQQDVRGIGGRVFPGGSRRINHALLVIRLVFERVGFFLFLPAYYFRSICYFRKRRFLGIPRGRRRDSVEIVLVLDPGKCKLSGVGGRRET